LTRAAPISFVERAVQPGHGTRQGDFVARLSTNAIKGRKTVILSADFARRISFGLLFEIAGIHSFE
jgi:hypothetical protein